DPKQPEGAASALRRLEEAEAKGYQDFKRATASGDEHYIKTSRENWLKISESLRRFDLALEQNRRDNGELVQKDQIQKALGTFAALMRFPPSHMADQLAPTLTQEPDFIRSRIIIRRCGYETAILTCGCLQQMGVPSWFLEPFRGDLVRNIT